jgi:hypothetical protein
MPAMFFSDNAHSVTHLRMVRPRTTSAVKPLGCIGHEKLPLRII